MSERAAPPHAELTVKRQILCTSVSVLTVTNYVVPFTCGLVDFNVMGRPCYF